VRGVQDREGLLSRDSAAAAIAVRHQDAEGPLAQPRTDEHRLNRCHPLRRRHPLPQTRAPGSQLTRAEDHRLARGVVSWTGLGGMRMSLLDRIVIDPEICHGKPSIRGLRYPVETILELLSSGMTTEEILADYEDLEREDILAALELAAKLSQTKRVVPLVA